MHQQPTLEDSHEQMELNNSQRFNGEIQCSKMKWVDMIGVEFWILFIANAESLRNLLQHQSILPSLKPNSLPQKNQWSEDSEDESPSGIPYFQRQCWFQGVKPFPFGVVFDENQHQSWSSLSVDALNLG